MVRQRAVIDVSELPTHGFGNRSIIWWGVMGFLAIETTMLVICMASFFYLRPRFNLWPPVYEPPDLLLPTINLALLLLSVPPMYWVDRAARRLDLRSMLIGMAICIALGIAFTVVRFFEFGSLNVRWDANAYGSALWTMMGLHTFHLLAEVIETIVLAIFLLRGHTEVKYFVDTSDNALYWYFIVLIWLPLYAVIYFGPRVL